MGALGCWFEGVTVFLGSVLIIYLFLQFCAALDQATNFPVRPKTIRDVLDYGLGVFGPLLLAHNFSVFAFIKQKASEINNVARFLDSKQFHWSSNAPTLQAQPGRAVRQKEPTPPLRIQKQSRNILSSPVLRVRQGKLFLTSNLTLRGWDWASDGKDKPVPFQLFALRLSQRRRITGLTTDPRQSKIGRLKQKGPLIIYPAKLLFSFRLIGLFPLNYCFGMGQKQRPTIFPYHCSQGWIQSIPFLATVDLLFNPCSKISDEKSSGKSMQKNGVVFQRQIAIWRPKKAVLVSVKLFCPWFKSSMTFLIQQKTTKVKNKKFVGVAIETNIKIDARKRLYFFPQSSH